MATIFNGGKRIDEKYIYSIMRTPFEIQMSFISEQVFQYKMTVKSISVLDPLPSITISLHVLTFKKSSALSSSSPLHVNTRWQ